MSTGSDGGRRGASVVTSQRVPPAAAAARPSRRAALGSFITRHPVLTVLVVALLARLTLAVLVSVFLDGAVFADDTTYVDLAADRAAGNTDGWDDYTWLLYESTWTFSAPLTALFWLFGPSVLLGQALAASFGAATAAIVTRLCLQVLPVRWALVAGLVVALLPSQVLFSSLVLKDASVWAVLAGLALVIALANRSRGWRLLGCVAGLVALLYLVGHLREHTLIAAAWALALASLFGSHAWRFRRAALVFAVAVVVPWTFGLGAAGVNFAAGASETLEQRRQANAVGAATAVVPVEPVESVEPGEPGAGPTGRSGIEDNLRYLPRGLVVVLLAPLPWELEPNPRLYLALAENVVWWPLLLLATIGLVSGRRRLDALAFPALAAGALAALYALSEGNFGTAFRHRGEVVWAVALLATVGMAWVAALRARRRMDSAAG